MDLRGSNRSMENMVLRIIFGPKSNRITENRVLRITFGSRR